MGMARIPLPLSWDDEHTEPVEIIYVQYNGTESFGTEIGPRFAVRVCKSCRRSKDLCKCSWRKRR